jgi:hypothetical protein
LSLAGRKILAKLHKDVATAESLLLSQLKPKQVKELGEMLMTEMTGCVVACKEVVGLSAGNNHALDR